MKLNALIFLIAISFFARSLYATPVALPAPPAMSASAYILQDFQSGRVLAEENADARVEPASITKVMTTYVVFDALRRGAIKLEDQALISEKAWRNPAFPDWMESSRMFAEVHSKVSIEDLLRGLIVQSGNDAAVALAEHVAGSEAVFVQMMNQEALRLGMKNSHYINCSGFPEEAHYTSARDTAILGAALIRDFPELYKMFAEKSFKYNNIAQTNRNTLLWKDESVDGIKTGHSDSAGYCLLASAQRDDMRLLSVVMGTQNDKMRTQYSRSLLDYGFRFYRTHKLFEANTVLREERIWGGSEDILQLGLAEDFYITIPRGEYERLSAKMDVRTKVEAPVQQGMALGAVRVSLAEEVLAERPLLALNNVAQGNLLQRFSDWVLSFFE